MKKKFTATSAAFVALVGLSRIALADGEDRFTPVEALPPEQRQEVFEKLSQMTNGAELDWEHVVVGVNNEGQVVLAPRDACGAGGSGNPSCTGNNAHVSDSDQ